VPAGDALSAANDQQFAFQYGVRVPDRAFTVHTQVLAPFAGTTPVGSESMGFFIGLGDQDNFVQLVAAAEGGAPELQLTHEGIPSAWFDNITQGSALGLIATSADGAHFPASWSALDTFVGSP
jgi:hypothetical protein